MDSSDLAAVWLTLQLATVVTLLYCLIGTPIVWRLARTRSIFKSAISAVVALPLVLPPTVIGFIYWLRWGRNGPIGQLTESLGFGTLALPFTGLVVASVFYSPPFVVQPIQNALRQLAHVR